MMWEHHLRVFEFCSRKYKNDIKYCILAWLSVVCATCDGGIRKSNLMDYVLMWEDLGLLPDHGINSRDLWDHRSIQLMSTFPASWIGH
jgi:hypothetical protein